VHCWIHFAEHMYAEDVFLSILEDLTLIMPRVDTALVLGDFKHNHPEFHSKWPLVDLSV
jgi:hypothetical protein